MYWRKIFITLFFSTFLPLFAAQNEQNLEILKALMLIDEGKNSQAAQIYEKLFAATKDGAYLKESIKLAMQTQDLNKLDKLLKKGEKILKNDTEFMRMLIMQHLSKGELEKAKNIAKQLIKIDDKNARNHIIMGGISLYSADEKQAIMHFKKAYELDGSEESVLRLSDVLLSVKDENESKKYLEDFKNHNGCTLNVCETLGKIYAKNAQFKEFADINKELYEIDENEEYLKAAVGAYVVANDLAGFENIAKTHNIDQNTTIHAYAEFKEHKKAYELAKMAFENTKEAEYQALMATLEYEQAHAKPTQEALKSIISNFEASVGKLKSAPYYNYYGYLLIDHNIDVNKGIELVKKALELEPNSAYYLDSLAWGYYKLGECQIAQTTISQALLDEEFAKEDDAKIHKQAIDLCDKKDTK